MGETVPGRPSPLKPAAAADGGGAARGAAERRLAV
jgi:hypothetical protein